MRIAVVGGGAAGMVAAWLLDRAHDVTVFEAAPVLGGNIRTLGRNAPAAPGVDAHLDAGVIEFEGTFFPTVVRLFDRLGVPTTPVDATTTFFPLHGPRLMAPAAITLGGTSAWRTWLAQVQLLRSVAAARRFHQRTRIPHHELVRLPVSEVLGDTRYDRWLELLTLYAYSTPRDEVRAMPAALVVPMLRDFVNAQAWFRVDGGVFRYVEAITAQLRGTVRTGTPVERITRADGRVQVTPAGEAPIPFDEVVLAVTPDRILPLLADASPLERGRLGAWRGRDLHTVVHHDDGPYTRRGATVATEFDVFELPDGRGAYNAWLDRLCDVHDPLGRRFGLAYGLDDELDPDAIVHVQDHHVPAYTVEAFRHRDAVRADNGLRHTWYAGAWLGDGLHEGAVSSAAEVAAALGGDPL